jgi:hypothetical protein
MVNSFVLLYMGGLEVGAIMTVVMVLLLIAILPAIFFLLTLQTALSRCAPQNRTMPPGQVWLMFIPLFNLVWMFIVVSNVAASLENEFRMRNIPCEPQPGKSIGLAYCILGILGIIPFVGIVTSIASLICWIVYWVKISGFSSEIAVPYGASQDYGYR